MPSIPTNIWTQSTGPRSDAALAQLAAIQHGVVSLGQLLKLGWSASAVRSRVAAGKLHRVHRGVYAVGHPVLTWESRLIAAVLACGSRSAISHRSAAALHGLLSISGLPIDITARTGSGRSRPGIRAHEGQLLKRDVTIVRNIPCTTVARTVLDCADDLTMRRLERLIDQAEVNGLLDAREMDDVLARSNGRRGAPKVRAVLAINEEPAITKSEMEELMLAICRDSDLPRPIVNGYVEGEQVDFHWPAHQVVAETDGKRWHGTHRRRERDNARDRKLQLAGWRVLRFSWRAVALEPASVAADLAPFLRGPAARRVAS